MDIKLEVAIPEFLNGNGVIKVFSIFAVYRDRQKITLIASSTRNLINYKFRIGIDRQRFNFFKHLLRECLRQAVLP